MKHGGVVLILAHVSRRTCGEGGAGCAMNVSAPNVRRCLKSSSAAPHPRRGTVGRLEAAVGTMASNVRPDAVLWGLFAVGG